MTGEISFVEYIAPVINKLREMGYEVTCELNNKNSYTNPFQLKLEIKDNDVKYAFTCSSSGLEGIRKNLDMWLEYVLGIKTQG
jgi:hypothetical protein